MTLAAKLRARKLEPLIAKKAAIYERDLTPGDIAAIQLERFNAGWRASLAESPYARALRARFELPGSFESWTAFDEAVPVTDKASLTPVISGAPDTKAKAYGWRSTGGSTGEPFRFPVNEGEIMHARCNIWLGRRWLGVSPSESMFLMWGHAHQLGQGMKGRINKAKRQVSDALMGYIRHSAYDLAPHHLDRACERLLRQKPPYVVGYASALDRFARHNADRAGDIAALGLNCVIATAEPFPYEDSVEVVARTFGTGVFMEYGATEFGPLAHQLREGGYRVYWADHRISVRKGDDGPAPEVLITSLYPRALPLLRYALGDAAEPEIEDNGVIRRLRRVVGACNATVLLPDGSDVHFEAFSHCVHDADGVVAFQFVRRPGDWPLLRYLASETMRPDVEAEVRRRLAVIAPGLGAIRFERSDALKKSVAGKHKVIVDA